MLDACRDNPFAATMQHTIELKLVDKGFSDIEPSAGFMVVYAAKHGETALDGAGTDSPFATAIAPIYAATAEEFANSAAYLHEVSGGRFQFGIGVAHAPALQRMGVTPGKPLAEAPEGILNACPVEQRRGIAHAASIS